MTNRLEICCYSVESAILAEQNGADRVELCDNYSEGGTTPSFGSIKIAIDRLSIPVNVIVRPRGGDFLYSDIEYETIKSDIEEIKRLNANGVVVGFLQSDGEIDLDKTAEIVKLAAPMEVTFHRAFDMCSDPIKSLDQLISAGVARVLTSGTANKAPEGVEILQKLVERAGDKISIMPGSGVNENNIKDLLKATKASEFHSSAKTFKPSLMEFCNDNLSMGGVSSVDEFSVISVDGKMVKKMKHEIIR